MEKIVRRDKIGCGAETRLWVGATVCRSNENAEKADCVELIWIRIELFSHDRHELADKSFFIPVEIFDTANSQLLWKDHQKLWKNRSIEYG